MRSGKEINFPARDELAATDPNRIARYRTFKAPIEEMSQPAAAQHFQAIRRDGLFNHVAATCLSDAENLVRIRDFDSNTSFNRYSVEEPFNGQQGTEKRQS